MISVRGTLDRYCLRMNGTDNIIRLVVKVRLGYPKV